MQYTATPTFNSIERLEESLFKALKLRGASYLKAESMLVDGLPSLEVESDLQEDPWHATVALEGEGRPTPLIEHVRVLMDALEARCNPLESRSKCQQLHLDCKHHRVSFKLTAEPTCYSAWDYALGAECHLAH